MSVRPKLSLGHCLRVSESWWCRAELLFGRFPVSLGDRTSETSAHVLRLSAKEKAGMWELPLLPIVLSSCPLSTYCHVTLWCLPTGFSGLNICVPSSPNPRCDSVEGGPFGRTWGWSPHDGTMTSEAVRETRELAPSPPNSLPSEDTSQAEDPH